MTRPPFPRPRSIEWLGGRTPAHAPLRERHAPELGPECYALELGERTVTFRFADEAGRRYGQSTLDQLRADGGDIPCCRIEDGPDFAVRGFMLDVSRDRVPTRDTLERLVARLAALRFNHLQLYTEHTFAYAGHEAVWRDASPLHAGDVRWLDRLCAENGIELAANQNTFGHMERWLAHDAYGERAETPGGFEHAGRHRSPTALAPTPENADFALGLVRELLSHHSSRRVNIGCDEVWELGRGKSAALVEARGKPAVFVEHLRRLAEPLLADGYEVQFWADMVQKAPRDARSLARDGAIAAIWSYEAPAAVGLAGLDLGGLPEAEREGARRMVEVMGQGFGPRLREFANAGFRTWVVPGTSGWNSLLGRHANARGNLRDAVASGLAHGVEGVLVTEWGDNGHWQPPFATLPALAYGGATAWCHASNADLSDGELAIAVSALVEDPRDAFGAALVRLGGVADALQLPQPNGTAFFYALAERTYPWPAHTPAPGALERATGEIETALEELARARPAAGDGELLLREMRQAAAVARHGLARMARRDGAPAPDRETLAAELEALKEEQRACWLARSRPGGLDDSLARFPAPDGD